MSELNRWLSHIPQPWTELGRHLSESEITSLESQQCTSTNWHEQRCSLDFSPENYYRCHFSGTCFLNPQKNNKSIFRNDIEFEIGVKNVKLKNVYLQKNIHIESCSSISDTYIAEEVVIHSVDFITYKKWSDDLNLEIGTELGHRILQTRPEISFNEARAQLEKPFPPLETPYRQDLSSTPSAPDLNFNVIGESSTILSTPRLHGVCLGPHTLIDRALGISQSIVLSNSEEPCTIGPGALCELTHLQWGSQLDSGGKTKSAIIGEKSIISHHAIVENTYIGPNNHISKTEITASFLGPFVGVHHQSLVIGVLWPEGLGNVGYGANIGSNHTGKAPDQEFMPGEGCFLGLSCSIKYPANFKQSPYSIISSGVTTLPQKMAMPFSLINCPSQFIEHGSPAFNEIMPAWVLSENLYALWRNELKFKNRNKCKRSIFRIEWLRLETVLWMQEAQRELNSISNQEWYTSKDIPSIGKNILSEKWRIHAIELYLRFSRFFAVGQLLKMTKGEQSLSLETTKILKDIVQSSQLDPKDHKSLASVYLEDLNHQVSDVKRSKARDFTRGNAIFDDYDLVHPKLDLDPVLLEADQKLKLTQSWCSEWL